MRLKAAERLLLGHLNSGNGVMNSEPQISVFFYRLPNTVCITYSIRVCISICMHRQSFTRMFLGFLIIVAVLILFVMILMLCWCFIIPFSSCFHQLINICIVHLVFLLFCLFYVCLLYTPALMATFINSLLLIVLLLPFTSLGCVLGGVM